MRWPALLSLLALVLAGCTASPGGSDPNNVPQIGFPTTPSYNDTTPANVRGLEHVAQLMRNGTPFPVGSGNFVLGDYVFGSALSEGFFIASVADPANPVLLHDAPDDGITPSSRKAEVVAHADGRRTLVLAAGGNGAHVWNVTDPANPDFGAIVKFQSNGNVHYVAQVPGTPYFVANPSNGQGGANHLVDVTDPYNPRDLGEFGSYGCHGTTFLNSFGDPKFRGYCAGVQATEIWDMTGLDASKPGFGIKVLSAVTSQENPVLGTGGLHHLAAANSDGTILIIGDEYSGGGQPGGCTSVANVPVRSPVGALWFYDVSNEAAPVLKGWVSPDFILPFAPPVPLPADPLGIEGTAGAGCTAHFGQIIPGQEKMVIAWYAAGILLIDFSDPVNPTILDQERPAGGNAWSARVQNGYVFTGDIDRGMDVYKLV